MKINSNFEHSDDGGVAGSPIDAIVHPVRLRILLAFGAERRTTEELVAALPDVPQASLYRHLNRLIRAGVLQVVDDAVPRRGNSRTYVPAAAAGRLGPEDLAGASREDHLRYFAAYLAALMSAFRAYIDGDSIDFVADGTSYWMAPLSLSPGDLGELKAGIRKELQESGEKAPAGDGRRQVIAVAVIPSPPPRSDQGME